MKQSSLFASCDQIERYSLKNGLVDYHPSWLPGDESNELMAELLKCLCWQQSSIRLYGKSVLSPRLSVWYGDTHCEYAYSKTHFMPKPWVASLFTLRQKLEEALKVQFNCVLANLYRDGQDSVAWHSDDEIELGINPTIASVSIGDSRRFLLRRKDDHQQKIDFSLGNGSLLVMAGQTQQYWQHQVPKTQKPVGQRINLTFRYIAPRSE